jgi:drug/metabolite transporter (DMT)-like permease
LNLRQFSLVIAVVVLMSFGQVLFKLTSRELAATSGPPLALLQNQKLLMFGASGFVLYAITSVLWVLALRGVDLSRAYPIAALGYVLVPVLGIFLLSEKVSGFGWLGIALIVAGVWVSAIS